MQVVDNQDGRPYRALFGDQREQLLGQHRRYVSTPAGRDLAAQQSDDGVPPRVDRRLAHLQSVEERQQWQCLAQLVAGSPEDVAADLGGGYRRGTHQDGLANTRLALDEHGAPAPPGDLSHEPG